MQVILYKNASDNNVADKNLTQVAVLDLDIKSDCDKVSPVILLSQKYDANYAFIHDFQDRYYFLTVTETKRKDLWRYAFTSDPLMSFKGEWRQLRAIISRTADSRYSDKNFDDNIVQSTLKVDRHNQIINFPNTNGFYINDATIQTELETPMMLVTNGPGGIRI